jgi:hypothetical protein
MKIITNKEETPILPDSQFIIEVQDTKQAVQNACFVVRNLSQSAQFIEPVSANELMATALKYVDSGLKLLEAEKKADINVASCYDVFTSANMVLSLAQQSSIQGQYVRYFNSIVCAYAANISNRAVTLIKEVAAEQVA